MKSAVCGFALLASTLASIHVASAGPGAQVDKSVLARAKIRYESIGPAGHGFVGFATGQKSGIPDIDSIPNFTGSFTADGFDQSGNPQTSWVYDMVGGSPERGGFTVIDAPVVPVSLDLLGPDGQVVYHYDVTPYVWPTLLSPIFIPHQYTSSNIPTQYTDAVQRAEFWKAMHKDWHTWLLPRLATPRTMRVPAGSYQYALNPDGTLQFVLIDEGAFVNQLFPASPTDTASVMGAAENAHEITTRSITTFLLPNTFLTDFSGGCCIVGFHSYDVEPGDARNKNREKRFVMNYSSWVTPGLFGDGGFEDVTAFSHEMSELFNNPFVASDGVHNIVPWWLSGPLCDDTNEVGDVIEVLPKLVTEIQGPTQTYHVQNEALLPWFARETVSSAIHHAYSYPDETALPALSDPQKPFCQP